MGARVRPDRGIFLWRWALKSPQAGRSIFAVGDVKQSIFSFQRADPEACVCVSIAAPAQTAFKRWVSVDLEVLCSGAAILGLVDRLFNSRPAAEGVLRPVLTISSSRSVMAFPAAVMPALWNSGRRSSRWREKMTATGPYQPPSAASTTRPPVSLALLPNVFTNGSNETKFSPRKATGGPGDIDRCAAGAVRQRRALKERDIDVAGADRMVLSDQIAVMDLIALGRFPLLPDDDLTWRRSWKAR